MDFGTPPPVWQEPPVFSLPGVPMPDVTWSLGALVVRVHGIDGETFPQLWQRDPFSSSTTISVTGESQFRYSPAQVVGSSATEQTLAEAATALLNFLYGELKKVSTSQSDTEFHRTIMLFAYDVGGCVVKEALVLASRSEDEREKSVLDAISLVVFYGTPHQDWSVNILPVIHSCFTGLLGDWVPSYVQRMADHYGQLNHDFVGVVVNQAGLRVLNVCQRVVDSPSWELIIQPSSACLDIPREEEVLLLDRSHYQLAICLGSEEEDYQRATMLDAAIQHCKPYQICLETLRHAIRKLPLLAAAEHPQENGNVGAYFDDGKVVSWREGSGPSALRLSLPGELNFDELFDSLASQIHDQTQPDNHVILRLGPREASVTEQQALAMLCLQFLEQRPSMLLWARHLCPNVRDAIMGLDAQWELRALAGFLRNLFLTPKQGATFCFFHVAPGNVAQEKIVSQLLCLMEASDIPFRLLVVTNDGAEIALSSIRDVPCAAGPSPESDVNNSKDSPDKKPVEFINDGGQGSIDMISRCFGSSNTSWVLRVLAWASFAVRPLSFSEMEAASDVACAEDGPLPTCSRRGRALMSALELVLPGLLHVRGLVVWTAPELSLHLQRVWAEHFGEGECPQVYLARACFRMVAPYFQVASMTHPDGDTGANDLLAYATKYWIEHFKRGTPSVESDAVVAEEMFSAILRTSPDFNQAAWIRYLSSSNWSQDITKEARLKIHPTKIQQTFKIGPFQACYLSYRMSMLPLNAQDNLDWRLSEIANTVFSGERYVHFILDQAATTDEASTRLKILQRAMASASLNNTTREQLLQGLRRVGDTEFLSDNFVTILLTAIAVGNRDAVDSLLPFTPRQPLGLTGANTSTSGLGTALQVACEYGDDDIAEKILDWGANEAFKLEAEYPWNATHVACHQGWVSLVRTLVNRSQEAAALDITAPASPIISLFRVASSRGLHEITEILRTMNIPADNIEESLDHLSSLQIASRAGFSRTITSLFRSGCKVTLKRQQGSESAVVLAVRSGREDVSRKVHQILMSEVNDEYMSHPDRYVGRYVELDDSDEDEDDNSNPGSPEGPDAENDLLRNAAKFIGDSLLVLVATQEMPLSLYQYIVGHISYPDEIKDEDGRRLLHLAARMGRLDLVRELYPTFMLMDPDKSGRTAMHYACHHGHIHVVKHFVDREDGYRSNLKKLDKQAETPVTAAALGGHLKMLNLLLPCLSLPKLKSEFSRAAKRGLVGAMDLILKRAVKLDPSSPQAFLQARDSENPNSSSFTNSPPFTALHHAVSRNDLRMIQFLLLRHSNPNDTSRGCATPLGLAAKRSALESMRLLLDAGAATDVPTPRGRTILSEAVFSEQPAAVKLLLKYGAPTHLPHCWKHHGDILRFSVGNSSLEVFRVLLEHFERTKPKIGPPPQEIASPGELLTWLVEGRNNRHFCAVLEVLDGQYEQRSNTTADGLLGLGRKDIGVLLEKVAAYGTVRSLLAFCEIVKGRVDVNDTGGFYGTAIQAAACDKEEGVEKMKILLTMLSSQGAGLEQSEGRDGSADSASLPGSMEIRGYWGTALHPAAWYRNRPVMEFLLEKQSGLKDQRDRMGRLPLHLCAMRGEWEMAQQLTSDISTFLSKDHQGRTALHLACGRGQLSFVQNLLDSRSAGDPKEVLELTDVDGWTALHWACRSRDRAIVEYLLKAGACPNASATTPRGWLPYHVAVHNCWEQEVPQGIRGAYENTKPDSIKDEPTGGKELSEEELDSTARRCNCCYCSVRESVRVWYKCQSDHPTCRGFELCDKCWRHASIIHFPDHDFARQDGGGVE